jgi:peptidoglycan/xylan/chitin deacetylase (PgdA/CDA1 family)
MQDGSCRFILWCHEGANRSLVAAARRATVAGRDGRCVPAPAAVAPNVARDGPAGTFTYTMQPGDTLFSLATRFGTTVEILIALNGIEDVNDIPSGLVLFIPEATPTPTATATPSATTTPISGPSLRIDHGPRNSGAVALTFDMGGRVEPALDIMNWLVANEVRATIFMTGAMANNVNTDAGRQVLAIVDAHPELFELGNHSYSHPDFRELTAAQMREELHSTEAAVAQYTDMPMRPLFRPPYGGLNQAVLDAVGPAGYAYTIMWDVDTIDWLPEEDGGDTAQEMVAKVVNNAQGGSIVLMHLGGYNTFDALPGIKAGLEARGFEFVRVSELLD